MGHGRIDCAAGQNGSWVIVQQQLRRFHRNGVRHKLIYVAEAGCPAIGTVGIAANQMQAAAVQTPVGRFGSTPPEHTEKAAFIQLQYIAVIGPAEQMTGLILNEIVSLRMGYHRNQVTPANLAQGVIREPCRLTKCELHQQIPAAAQRQQRAIVP